MRAWFYDTWGFLALANAADVDHGVASEADRWREEKGLLVVTTDYVLDESLTALHRAAGGRVAVRFLDLLLARVSAGLVMVVQLNSLRLERAQDVFRKLAPRVPGLSFTDCTSFAVMSELGLTVAFTADRDFRRPGGEIRPLFTRRKETLVWTAEVD